MIITWKVQSIEMPTVQEANQYVNPDSIVAVQLRTNNYRVSCRELRSRNKHHKNLIGLALWKQLPGSKILKIAYQRGGARVLVRKVA